MYVLVINSGSSSVKYELFRMPHPLALAKGIVERIGQEGSFLRHKQGKKDEIKIKSQVPDHNTALKLTLDTLVNPEYGVIKDLSEILAVGHRVVHGGEEFSDSIIINDRVIRTIEKCIELAPLHNPPNLSGILACKKFLPGVTQVAVFDTAFYHSMPPKAYVYGLPYNLYKKLGIRRYGFHGTSHKYVALRTAELLGNHLHGLKIITCHLGNGCSITATEHGHAVDTSMGFTPLEGLLMGTRCGDIDPAVVFYLMDKEKLSVSEINNVLNKKSGLLGLSGVSNDMRDVYESAKSGNNRAKLAFEVFVHRIQKYIGAYSAVMNGVDAIAFTAGIGENHAATRKGVCDRLSYLGIKLDSEINRSKKKEKTITTRSSKVKVLVVPTNEELMIARDAYRLYHSKVSGRK